MPARKYSLSRRISSRAAASQSTIRPPPARRASKRAHQLAGFHRRRRCPCRRRAQAPRLLRDGVHLFELKPDAAILRDNGLAKIHLRPTPGRSSLHAKLFVIDRRRCFIGSFNLDPRSARLNTEMGMMVDCPDIAAQAAAYARSLMDTAYSLSLDGSQTVHPRLIWSSPTGATYTKDPHTSRAARLFVHLLSLLPIEAQF